MREVDGVLQADDDRPCPVSEPVPGTLRLLEVLGDSAHAEADRMRSSALSYAEELREAIDHEAEQLLGAAARQAGIIRATAAAEAEWVRADARRAAEEVLAEARADARARRAAAEEEAGGILVAAADEAAKHLADTAADELRQATEAATRIRAGAQQEAELLLEAGHDELEAANEANGAATSTAQERRDEAQVMAADWTTRAARDLSAARLERLRAEREGAQVVSAALGAAGATLLAARREYDSASELVATRSRESQDQLAQAAPPVPSPPPLVGPQVETPPRAPLLVPALSLGRELVLRLLVWLGLGTAAWFWVWWLSQGHGSWSPGSVTVTVLLAWVFALPGYFYFFACRMTRPNPNLPIPVLRVAMVVTKAPSEPWPIIQRTLEAMLAQELPLAYDVWLADERPTEETRQWCAANSVLLSSREGVAGYQRDSWPRRKRSKEGNLAFFYDRFGYERYDVVAQLDADHVPAPGYLADMVRPFADSRVGYVAAPSVCDANADQGWTVRGRLYREAAMHGPVQAGSNGGYGPVCIGSHYAVRTVALRDVGGIGPELAEDYSTTLWMQSGGWDGVFAIDAEAHGDGPESVDEMLLQELQWARSLGTILTRWAPGRLRRVPWRARLRLGFALAFYPVQGLALAAASVLPLVGVALRTSWGETSIVGFYVHVWPNTVVGLLTAAYLRRCRLLRPKEAKLWSWELTLFQLVRWPWTFWGFLHGMYAGSQSKPVGFKVTQKAAPGLKPLRPQSLVPTLALGVVPAMAVVLVPHPGTALGLQVLAGLQAASYLLCAVAVVALHLASNRRRLAAGDGSTRAWFTWTSGGAASTLVGTVVGICVAALAWRLHTYGLGP